MLTTIARPLPATSDVAARAMIGVSRSHVRGFRFIPWWSSSSDAQEARRRHGAFRYRYMESVNQKSPWETQPETNDVREAVKQALARLHRVSELRSSRGYVDADKVQSWSDELSANPSRNIEDVEQDAMNHLFRHIPTATPPLWQDMDKDSPSQHASMGRTTIDPITNRRVPITQTPPSSLSQGDAALMAAALQSETSTQFTPKYEDVDCDSPTQGGIAQEQPAHTSPAEQATAPVASAKPILSMPEAEQAERAQIIKEIEEYSKAGLGDPLPTEASYSSEANSFSERWAPSRRFAPNLENVALHSKRSRSRSSGQRRRSLGTTKPVDDVAPRSRHLDASPAEHEEPITASGVRARILQKTHEMSQERSSQGQVLSGQYSRDYPEEFTQTWVSSGPEEVLHVKGADIEHARALGDGALQGECEISSMDESFLGEDFTQAGAPIHAKATLEPALNRQGEPAADSLMTTRMFSARMADDQFSKEPQGLQTCFKSECTTEPGQVLFRTHGDPNTCALHSGEAAMEEVPVVEEAKLEGKAEAVKLEEKVEEKVEAAVPSVFKVLAFDPATQTVNVAEATSQAGSPATPMSPADVLPLLSNPAKFFPYFQSLQSQGFEIVSGSGDVLVFRQVRPAAPDATDMPVPSNAASESVRPAAVNPIDLMGKPVMGNFASATGFIQYDGLAAAEDVEHKPSPPFRPEVSGSSIAVEPPVSENGSTSMPKRKKSMTRKMALGTAYVVGGVYAANVVGEFFGRR